jgi:hypothetical protein
MKTEKELNQAILEITLKIQNENPELNKYLSELPVTIPDINNPQINCKVLQDYYDSLQNILKKYREGQQ